MGRGIRFVALTLVLAAATGGVSLAIASDGAEEEPIRLVIRAGEGRGAFLDFNGNGRIDPGDRHDGWRPLRDPATGDRVGRSFAECTAMTRIVVEKRKGTWMCTYVLRLADGHITLRGS